jgi:hypothetical protein
VLSVVVGVRTVVSLSNRRDSGHGYVIMKVWPFVESAITISDSTAFYLYSALFLLTKSTMHAVEKS